MLDKWLRPKPMLSDGKSTDSRDDLVAVLVRVRDTLVALGHQVFVVGGTALGPYRDGDLLPHDDDADVAVLLDDGHPSAVARSMMRLRRKLEGAGFRVRVHSFAHLQVYPNGEDNALDRRLYVDIFAAYFSGDVICQPFHVRGAFSREQLLPFRTIDIRGESFAVPADIESWLALNYDDNWRVPQPGFQLDTPEATSRRFNSQYGSFNLHRHFWEMLAVEHPSELNYEHLESPSLSVCFDSPTIVNVGCGSSVSPPASISVSEGSTVVGIDYADAARELAHSRGSSQVFDVSVANYNAVLGFALRLPPGAFDVYAGFVAESLDPRRRKSGFWPLMRLGVRSGGTVLIDFLDQLGDNYSFDDPRTWHLELAEVFREATGHGLAIENVDRGTVRVDGNVRSYTRVQFASYGTEPQGIVLQDSSKEWGMVRVMFERLKKVRRNLKAIVSRPPVLLPAEAAREIERLRSEIDEVREDQRRVAELADIVEEMVLNSRSPGAQSLQETLEGPNSRTGQGPDRITR